MRLIVGLLVTVTALAISCDDGDGDDDDDGSSSSSGTGGSFQGPCNENPWSCPAGSTCWINMGSDGFECLPSGPGADGDSCINYIGQPTCSDGLMCFQLGMGDGVCRPFCDADHPCTGVTCQTLTYDPPANTLLISACAPVGGTGGSGGQGGSVVGGSGGSGGSGGAPVGGMGGTGG